MKKLLAVLSVVWLVGAMALVYQNEAHAQIPDATQASLWTCSLDDIGATLTKCVLTPAPLSDTTQSTYITTIIAQSTTTTGGTFIVRSGTGTNCGTGTTSLLPSAATAARLSAPANTAPPAVIALTTPLKVPPGKDICILGVATNTFTGQLAGYYGAP